MKARRKSTIVDAYQINKLSYDSYHLWPDWLSEARLKKEGEVGKVGTWKGRMYVWGFDGSSDITWNDWLVKGTGEEIHVYSQDFFTQNFELVEEQE